MRQSKIHAQLESLIKEIQTDLHVADGALRTIDEALTTSIVELEQDKEEFVIDVTHKIARVYDHTIEQQKGFLKTIQEIRKASNADKQITVPIMPVTTSKYEMGQKTKTFMGTPIPAVDAAQIQKDGDFSETIQSSHDRHNVETTNTVDEDEPMDHRLDAEKYSIKENKERKG